MKRNLLLFIIVIISAALRFYKLGEIPVSPDWDEVALGYNAYSVLKTGKDEYGTLFPLALRSFDDYKPPLYMYTAIPSVAAFGLTVWAVRLPSAVLGVSAVLATYLLVSELVTYIGKDKRKGYIRVVPLLSSFLLAISPWHIQFSRIAFEANVGITINMWAVYLFLLGLKKKGYLPGSAFLFGLGMYAYHSERIFLPLLVGFLMFVFRKELVSSYRHLILFVLVGVMTVVPLVPVVFDPTTLTRLKGTSTLSDQTGLLAKSVKKLEEDEARGDYAGALFENRRIVWAKTLIEGYLVHFTPGWLFLRGDNDRHHAPDVGLLYLWELPFVLWGIYALVRYRGRGAVVVFGWMIASPVAASPTSEVPHAIRSMVFLPMFQILVALGLWEFAQWIKNSNLWKKGITLVVFGFILFNISYYLVMYFRHLNFQYSRFWQYGYKEAVEYAEANKYKYKKIVVSTKLEQPHMFFLFYTKYDPVAYLTGGGTASGGFKEEENKFDVYEFRPIHWDNETKDGSILYMGSPQEILWGNLHTIKYLDGTDAIRITTH